jgi:hypothetical protein
MTAVSPASLGLALSILVIGWYRESRRLYAAPCRCGHYLSLHGLASGGCMACSCAAYEAVQAVETP